MGDARPLLTLSNTPKNTPKPTASLAMALGRRREGSIFGSSLRCETGMLRCCTHCKNTSLGAVTTAWAAPAAPPAADARMKVSVVGGLISSPWGFLNVLSAWRREYTPKRVVDARRFVARAGAVRWMMPTRPSFLRMSLARCCRETPRVRALFFRRNRLPLLPGLQALRADTLIRLLTLSTSTVLMAPLSAPDAIPSLTVGSSGEAAASPLVSAR
mmetsp:Transcript_5393/g.12996  ORF Transcript_5393/g.12996 Transcript_5393/m.12996 type:complete len:215 (+) Transcript_5393:391-1035(+)